MHEGILRKGLVVGIIMIFLGASAIPSLSGNVTSKFKINSSINSGLVGYWSFNDQNNPGFDDSGNNNQGTLNGVTWTPDGHSGGAVFFDASPDRIAFNSPVINTPPYSVCVWVKPNVFNANSYIICNGGETILHYGFYLMHNQNINSYGFGGYDSDGYGGAAYASYSVLNWTFLCGTWDGTNNPDSMLLYINGIPYAATNMGWWDNGPAANLLFGSPTKDPDLYGFFGIIDEVRIYDRVLSEDEIGELYQNPDINFLVSWLYPESSHDSQIQQYDYYPITLTVQNNKNYSQTFYYGLQRTSFQCYTGLKIPITPSWNIEEAYKCFLDGESYSFGTLKSVSLNPYQTKTFYFNIMNHWNWLPEGTLFGFITPQILSALEQILDISPIISCLDFLYTLGLKNAPLIKYNYIGMEDSHPSSNGYVDVWVKEEKQIAFVASVGESVTGGALSGLGLGCTATVALIIPAIILFIGEGSLIGLSQSLYDQAVDPDENYTEIVHPEPPYMPALENLSGINRTIALDFLNYSSYGSACKRSYAKYLGALDMGSTEWATIQLSSTTFYLEKLTNISKSLSLLINTSIPDFPPLTPENISDIRNYLSQNGLPEIEKDILYYYGFTDQDINHILQLLLFVNDSFYYNSTKDKISERFESIHTFLQNSSVSFPDPPAGALCTNLMLNPDIIDLNNSPEIIACYIEFINISNLTGYHINSALLNNQINPLNIAQEPGDYDNDGIQDIVIEYNGHMISEILSEGNQMLTIFGNVTTPSSYVINFSATNLIRVIGAPPETPSKPIGDSKYFVGIPYNCSATTTDLEESMLFYRFDWGDGNLSKWFGPYLSGESIYAEYIWSYPGEYQIKVKAMDSWGLESLWSENHSIKIMEIKNRTSIIFGKISNSINLGNYIKIDADKLVYIGFKPFAFSILKNGEEVVISREIIEIYRDSSLIIGIYKADAAI